MSGGPLLSSQAARNLAAHDYETDYVAVAEHFNALHDLIPGLLATAGRFAAYCRDAFGWACGSPMRPTSGCAA